MVFLALAFLLTSFSNQLVWTEICSTESCKDQSESLLKEMNLNVDPCDDFYEFCCGGFKQNTVLPESKNHVNKYSIAREKNAKRLQDTRNQRGLQEIEEALVLIDGWPILGEKWDEKSFNWQKALVNFNLISDTSVIFKVLIHKNVFTNN
ncbi:neprilysin-11-like protein, partial [Dinothrombium tinctorium]